MRENLERGRKSREMRERGESEKERERGAEKRKEQERTAERKILPGNPSSRADRESREQAERE